MSKSHFDLRVNGCPSCGSQGHEIRAIMVPADTGVQVVGTPLN